jgi:hypothetical protein
VFVPGPVMTPLLLAVIRRTSGETAAGSSCTIGIC